jgi:hypothetical protein
MRDLADWIGEILEVAVREENRDSESGLLSNYWGAEEEWFGEVSGSAVLTAVVFRVAVLQVEAKDLFESEKERPVNAQMLNWATEMLASIAKHVNPDGIASPAVDPLDWKSRTPYTQGSPEGQSFVVMLYAARRDCVRAGVCAK